ncbi:MAG: hypothetical protein H6744_12275 [Deltaproteobacteria bacterium]|nr:hypothetical protein [Deltaproteobacteria bacterium]
MHRPSGPLLSLCRRVRWRTRARSAIERGVLAGLLGGGVALVVLVLVRLRVLEAGALGPALGAAAATVGLAVLSGLLRRVSDLQAAQRLDRAAGLHDRLGSAIAFGARPEPTPMEEAAIRDAEAHVGRADPRAAAPLVWPRRGWALLAVAALGVGAWLMVVPVGPAEGRGLSPLHFPRPPARQRVTLAPEDRRELAEEAARLAEQAAAIEDPEVRSWVAELNELVRALQEGRITPEEAHARIARLSRARDEWSEKVGEGMQELASRAREAAEAVRRPHRTTSPLLEALRAEQWAAAARAMRELREKTERGDLSGGEARAVQRDLAALARGLESERQARERKAKRERDRLKKKEAEAKDRFGRRDRDRLAKAERELERLQREEQGAGEARRQLERLQRELDRAAQDLARRQQGDPDQQPSAEQMRRAEDIMRRLGELTAGQRQMRVARGRLIDLEEMMRRAGQQVGQGKDGQGKDGQGEGGQDEGGQDEGGQRERFLVRAGGDEPGGKKGQGKNGQQPETRRGDDVTLLSPGRSKAGGVKGGPGQGAQGPPVPGQGPGSARLGAAADGIGEGHDPRVLGERTEQQAAGVEDQVRGSEGAGPSQSRVIRSAASRGFATQSWRAVHQDYSQVVEQALERQEIPAGQRRYVRRYFDLIRPR